MATPKMPRPAPTADPRAPRPTRLKVRATMMGYYGDIRRRVGDVFVIPEHCFSPRWMERVPDDTPEKVTTGQQELRRQHDELLAQTIGTGQSATAVLGIAPSGDDPLGD